MNLPLLAVGPSPALQRELCFPGWDAPGDVVRCSSLRLSVGGKASNAVRAVHHDGGRATLLSFAGGAQGQRMRELFAAEGLEAVWVPTRAETRLCQTLLDPEGRRIRELVEEPDPVSPPEWAELHARFDQALSGHAGVLLCGSLPRNAPAGTYAGLVRRARAGHRPVLLDAKGPELLAALPERPEWVKINRAEALEATGCDSVGAAAEKLLSLGAGALLITDGSRPAFLHHGGRGRHFVQPSIEPLNPIGGGDTVAGVLMNRLLLGESPPEAARRALGAALAQALTPFPAVFDSERATAFAEVLQET